MLQAPFALLAALAAIVALVFQLESSRALEPLFRRLPPIFWVYMLPMLATSAGVLPEASPLYGVLTRHLLPASLVLILLSSDLKMILRLGPRALVAMVAAVVGICLGAIVAFLLLGDALGPEAWKGLAALVGTWTGGSANLLAVATSLGLSPDSQGIAIVVDTVVGYSWMGILIALSARQASLDRRLHADRGEVAAIGRRIADRARAGPPADLGRRRDASDRPRARDLRAGDGARLGQLLPPVGDVLTPFAWGILTVTTVGLLLSLTPLARLRRRRRLEPRLRRLLSPARGRRRAGRPQEESASQPLWIVAGVIVIGVHAIVLLAVLRWMRAPSFFLGAASQAATGGYSSAPVVAEIYQQGLAPVGLLLAVVGNVLGTYLGLAVGQLLANLAR